MKKILIGILIMLTTVGCSNNKTINEPNNNEIQESENIPTNEEKLIFTPYGDGTEINLTQNEKEVIEKKYDVFGYSTFATDLVKGGETTIYEFKPFVWLSISNSVPEDNKRTVDKDEVITTKSGYSSVGGADKVVTKEVLQRISYEIFGEDMLINNSNADAMYIEKTNEYLLAGGIGGVNLPYLKYETTRSILVEDNYVLAIDYASLISQEKGYETTGTMYIQLEKQVDPLNFIVKSFYAVPLQ